jgi:hypothetical protein
MALDFDLLRREYQEAIAQQAVDEYWVPDFGENLVRVLPPADGTLFYKKVGVHYRLVGSGMEFCPKLTDGASCPVCEVVDQLKKMNTPVAMQIVNRLAVVERYLMNVIPMKEGEEKMIRQYLAPKTVRLALLKIVLDPDYGDITDLERGRNVVIEKVQSSGGFVNYSVRAKPRETSIREVLGRPLRMEEIPDLNEFVRRRMKGYHELKAVLYGSDEDLGVEELMEKYSSSSSGGSDDQGKVDKRDSGKGAVQDTVISPQGQGGQMDLDEIIKFAKKVADQLK